MENDANSPTDVIKLIAARYETFTKSEKRIADFIRDNQDEAAFMPAGEIADALGISEPTITRFARALGFSSYPEMRENLQAKFRNLVKHSQLIRSRLDELREGGDIYGKLVTSEINFLTESVQTVDRAAFNQAVELLRNHQRVFVVGLGPATSLVDLLEIRLTRSARHVIPLRTYGRDILEPLLLMTKDDLLIAFGFRRVNPYLKIVLEQANRRGASVILITDTLGELYGKNATVVLSARRGPVSAFHSMTVPMTIVNSLLLALSAADQERIMGKLDELDEMREDLLRLEKTGHSSK